MRRASRATVLVVCLLAGLVATASPALAATITVDAGAADGAPDAACSLREAVEAANTDLQVDTCSAGTAGLDTISLPADPLIEVTGQIDISDDLVIQGVSSAATVIDLSGAGDDGFQVGSGSEVTFRQLAVDGGGNPHEAIDNRGDLTLESVYFTGNDNTNDGGAVKSEDNLTITNSTFEDNHGGARGGAVYQDFGSLTITNSTFENNSAESGGAVYALDVDVEISGTTEFTLNDANGAGLFDGGGALYLEGTAPGATALIDGTEFSSNTSIDLGGGLYMVGVEVTITGADFTDNVTQGGGGGLAADCTCAGGSLSIEDSEFSGNEADFGGGAFISGPATVTGTTFMSNTAVTFGGALFAEEPGGPFEFLEVQESHFEDNSAPGAGAIAAGFAQLYVTDSTLQGNHATGSDPGEGGGAIGVVTALVVLERTTVSGNDAVLVGGGILGEQAQVAVVNSTVSGNSVSDGSGEGGGVHFTNVLSRILHSTITGNSAPGEGGGVWGDDPLDVLADGSIIAGNPVGGDCNGAVDEDSPNLDSDGSCFPASGVGSITDNPMLGPLANNGGPTMTHALLAGSPALDIADGTPCNQVGGVDQRGLPRPSGGACDLGAFEVQVAAPPTPTHTLTVTNAGGGTVTSADLGIDCGTTCEATLDAGATGVLVATPDDGSTFVGWEGDCASIDENECTVEMDGDREVTARFVGVVKTGPCAGMPFGSSEVRGGTELIAGTPGDDVLSGNGRKNVICGLGGNDTIKGKNLGDDLLGGGGNDSLAGGKGPDLLKGGPGTDSCRGGKGKDTLIACE